MEDEISVQDTQPVEEAVIQEEEIQESTPEVDPAELVEKNKQLYARATKAEKELKEIKTKLPKPQESINTSPIEERFERQDLRIEGYASDEVDFIMKNGGRAAVK